MADTPFADDLVRRRRRPGAVEEEHTALVRYGTGEVGEVIHQEPAVRPPGTSKEANADIAEGRTFIHPREEFQYWTEIHDAVREEFVRRSSEHDSSAEAEKGEDRYFRMVSDVVGAHPQWGVANISMGRLVELLRIYQFGYGPLEDYMRLDGLEELYFNRYDQGFYIVRGLKSRVVETIFANEATLVQFVQRVADENGLEINAERPNLDAVLKDGSRLNATLAPLAIDGLTFNIRQFRDRPFPLEYLIETRMVSSQLVEDMRAWVAAGLTFVVSGGTGAGKAQPWDAKVLTPRGWKEMGDVLVGDEVMGPDGSGRRVVGVFPQGEKEIYKVTFSDGSTTECCADHLWTVQTKKHKYRNSGYRVLALREIMEDLKDSNGNSKWFIPMVEAADFQGKELPLDPYLMGQLLGNGGLTGTSPMLTITEAETKERVAEMLPGGLAVRTRSLARLSIDYCLSGTKGKINPVTAHLRALGLMGHSSIEKFIPEVYKWTTVENRVRLLQGLCDTDGYPNPHGAAEFGTSSPALARDMRWLVQSLGGRARISSRTPYYTHNGVRRQGAQEYRMILTLPASVTPFSVSRKLEKFSPRVRQDPTRAIVSVVSVGRKHAQCIAVDAADGLYITDDFIVTHNTAFLNTIGNAFIPQADRVIIIENRKELQIQTEDTLRLQTREDATRANQASDITIEDLIRWSLRKRPDRIIIGEVRGSEAYDALIAWNSGHDGSFCTIHADNAASAIDKLGQLAMGKGQLSETAVNKLISRSVDIVIQVERIKGRGERRVTEVAQVLHPRKYDRRRGDAAERVKELMSKDNENGMYRLSETSGDLWLLPLYEIDGSGQLTKVNELIPVQGKH